MVSISALIGGLIMLTLPIIQYVTIDVTDSSVLIIFGFFFFWTRIDIGSLNSTRDETFESSWIEENGIYEAYFGNALFGIIILLLIILVIVLSIAKSDGPLIGWLLIAAGVMLLAIRFLELNDADTFFYESDQGIISLEIPLGFIVGLIAGIKNLKSK